MTFIKKLLGSLNILCAFGCSNSNDEYIDDIERYFFVITVSGWQPEVQ